LKVSCNLNYPAMQDELYKLRLQLTNLKLLNEDAVFNNAADEDLKQIRIGIIELELLIKNLKSASSHESLLT